MAVRNDTMPRGFYWVRLQGHRGPMPWTVGYYSPTAHVITDARDDEPDGGWPVEMVAQWGPYLGTAPDDDAARTTAMGTVVDTPPGPRVVGVASVTRCAGPAA